MVEQFCIVEIGLTQSMSGPISGGKKQPEPRSKVWMCRCGTNEVKEKEKRELGELGWDQ